MADKMATIALSDEETAIITACGTITLMVLNYPITANLTPDEMVDYASVILKVLGPEGKALLANLLAICHSEERLIALIQRFVLKAQDTWNDGERYGDHPGRES